MSKIEDAQKSPMGTTIVNATKFNKKMEKPDGFFIKTNLLGNRHVTDGVIWTVDETEFNAE